MKIGFDSVSAAEAEARPDHPVKKLRELLGRHIPQHDYRFIDESNDPVEVYHSVGPVMPRLFDRRYARRVITVGDLNFLRYPRVYGLFERMVLLPLYRRDCRSADRLITCTRRMREALSEELYVDLRKIEVLPSVDLLREEVSPDGRRLAAVREKYDLPDDFLLLAGTPEPGFNQAAVLRAMADYGLGFGLVIFGRRSAYSDELLGFVRRNGLAGQVEFVYECDPKDLPALYALAGGLLYLPSFEASQLPMVEAMRAGLPMILSDTPLNRETAADAARYVNPESAGELAAALDKLTGDPDFRRQYASRSRRRAGLFSERAVAEALVRIYTSL